MCAAVAVGDYPDLDHAADEYVKVRSSIEPRAHDLPIYAAAYDAYREIFGGLRESGIFTTVTRLQERTAAPA